MSNNLHFIQYTARNDLRFTLTFKNKKRKTKKETFLVTKIINFLLKLMVQQFFFLSVKLSHNFLRNPIEKNHT